MIGSKTLDLASEISFSASSPFLVGSSPNSIESAIPSSVVPPLAKDLVKEKSTESFEPSRSRLDSSIARPVESIARIADRKSSIPGIRIQGIGYAVGSKRVTNADLQAQGFDAEWILRRTGIQSRFHVGENEATSDLAIRAAQQCLKKAGVRPDQIDLIIVATMTPDHLTPSTACLVQAALGCNAAALDMNAACSGFIYGLITASQFIRTGCSRYALVIGADVLTNVTNPKDLQTFPLFGDGAGAVLVTAAEANDHNSEMDRKNEFERSSRQDDFEIRSEGSGILAYRLASEGEIGKALLIPGGGSRMPLTQQGISENLQYLQMDGRTVFKWAVNLIPEVVGEMLYRAQLSIDEIDLFIPHQANIRIIDAAIETLGIHPDKVFINLDQVGNTSAGSIPIALAQAIEQGRIEPGSKVLMVGFGGGLTWGSCLMRW